MYNTTRVLAVLVMIAVPVRAQEGGPLDSLVVEALRANLGIQQARLADAGRAEGVAEARGTLLPQIGIGARYGQVWGGVDLGTLINPAYAALNQLLGEPAFPTNLDLTLPLRQDMGIQAVLPIVAPAAWAGLSLARSQRDASAALLMGGTRDLAAGVQVAYLQYAVAARTVDLFTATLDLLEENLRVSERLVAAGTATPDAVYRARTDRSEAQLNRSAAERQRDAAMRRLNELLDRPLETPVAVLADSVFDRDIPVTLEQGMASALARREDIAAAQARVRASGAQVRLATAAFLPTLAVAGQYGWQGNSLKFTSSNDVATVSLVLQWNLFSGGSDLARRRAASYGESESALALQSIALRAEREVREAYDGATTAQHDIEVTGEQVESARRDFELIRRRFEEGLAPHLDFVSARRAYTTAGINSILARYGYAIRLVELERAAALRTLPS